ncbi:hypothetical protein [Mucilaginibacter flavidus]|uniref:hypothetical protein n=1 Tax=Mucilaginibacter flavidus TaxID=2949309 RepID=UPI002093ACED|nr:hypothetical protein [Mucilaginibacter flavidus]MCO5947870.1 hypothetical protein [Mucilaginibacter flavidus]
MKAPLLFIILFGFFINITKAEVINGPANVRVSPNKQILVSLNDGVDIECGLLTNGWFKISFTIKITKQQYDKGYEVKKGDILIDQKNKIIGAAFGDIPTGMAIPGTYGGLKSPAVYEMEILGYVHQSNIKLNSIPENVIDSTFKRGAFSFQYESLRGFMGENHFKAQGIIKRTLPNCEEYCVYESTVIDPSPRYRIGLIFENSELIAIEHSRGVKIGDYKEHVTSDGNKLIIFRSPKNMDTKSFLNKINMSRAGAD